MALAGTDSWLTTFHNNTTQNNDNDEMFDSSRFTIQSCSNENSTVYQTTSFIAYRLLGGAAGTTKPKKEEKRRCHDATITWSGETSERYASEKT